MLDVDRVGEEEGGGLGAGHVDGPAVAAVEDLVAVAVAVAEVGLGLLQVGAFLVANSEDLALVLVYALGLVLLGRLSPRRAEALRTPETFTRMLIFKFIHPVWFIEKRVS